MTTPLSEGLEITENDSEEKYDFGLVSTDDIEDNEDTPLRKLREDTLDDYAIEEDVIGTGGYGSVFKAKLKPYNELKSDQVKKIYRLLGDQADVAIKIMIKKDGDEVAINFVNEQKKISEENLIHEYNLRYVLNQDCVENLVCYYDVFINKKAPTQLVLIMSLVTGKELFYYYEETKEEESYSDDEKKIITKQLLSAVRTLHSHNIVHKDIKIENIIYDKEKQYTTLIDYGFSCMMPKIEVKDYNVKECSNELAGTPYTMNPSLLLKDDITFNEWKSGDLYSLGIVLFELWIGPIEIPAYGHMKEDQRKKIQRDWLLSISKTNYITKVLNGPRYKDHQQLGKIIALISDLINPTNHSIEEIQKKYENDL